MMLAALDLGYDAQTLDSIGCAFAAVRAGDAPASCAQPAPEPDPAALKNGVARTSVITSSSSMSKLFWIDVPGTWPAETGR